MVTPPLTIDEALKGSSAVARNVSPFNTYGVPAISVPCGFSRDDLPVGLQIIGKPFHEAQVLGLAHAYEQATEWHTQRPAL
jgi:aspartyl-tRNA(Asn)/glutamyl-tRNA(Gln) amidotransferase subunit A